MAHDKTKGVFCNMKFNAVTQLVLLLTWIGNLRVKPLT